MRGDGGKEGIGGFFFLLKKGGRLGNLNGGLGIGNLFEFRWYFCWLVWRFVKMKVWNNSLCIYLVYVMFIVLFYWYIYF